MPEKHKETNKFTFRSFTERVKHVRVSAIYRTNQERAKQLANEGAASAYLATLARWADLDLSRAFRSYQHATARVRGDNYALVVHNQQLLVDTLILHLSVEHLEKNGWLAVPALLELLVSLSTDLSTDFGVHFERVFASLKALIRASSKLELTEAAFTCAAQLVKLNSRHLLAHLDVSINAFIDLAGDEKREHVRTFAGDAFGYLLRKLASTPPRYGPFWTKVLERVDIDSVTQNKAISELLFQSVRGIKGHADYRAHEVIGPLIQRDDEKSFKIVEGALIRLFDHLQRGNCRPILAWFTDKRVPIDRGVKFVESFVRYKSGILVPDVADILAYSDKLADPITLLSALLESTIPLTRSTREKLLNKLLEGLKNEIQVGSVLKQMKIIVGLSWFGSDYVSYLLNMAALVLKDSTQSSKEVTSVLVSYIFARHNDDMSTADNLLPPMFDFRLATVDPLNKVVETLLGIAQTQNAATWSALTVLAFTHHVPAEKVAKLLPHFSAKDSQSRVSFAAYIQLAEVSAAMNSEMVSTLVKAITEAPTDTAMLRSLDLVILKGNVSLEDLYPTLRTNLAHFNRHVRHHSLSIISKLANSEQINTLLAGERELADMANYREKLNFFRRWNADGVKVQDAFYLTMLGNLYVNFSLLMPEVKRMLVEDLERCFGLRPKETLDDVMAFLEGAIRLARGVGNAFDKYETLNDEWIDITNHYVPVRAGANETVDFASHRNKLWECAAGLSHLLEPRSRVLVPVFLDFVGAEFAKGLKFQHFGESKEEVIQRGKNSSRKMIVAALGIFAKFSNPAKLYREPELVELYRHLLESPDTQLQKAALECLLSYRGSRVARYADMLRALVDEKSFKNTFKSLFAKEDGVVNDEHVAGSVVKLLDEEAVFDVVYKIAFGKMLGKIASGSAGAASAIERQKFVIRNLVNADSAKHLAVFCQLALRLLDQYEIADFCPEAKSGYTVVESEKISLEAVMPFGKQLGLLATIQTLLKSANWSLEELDPIRKKLLLASISLGRGATLFLNSQLITRAKLTRQLKEIRTESVKTLSVYCNALDEKALDEQEESAVFGWLGGAVLTLNSDAHSSPTPLLRLIRSWCLASGHRKLALVKVNGLYVLEYVTKILTGGKASKETALVVLESVSAIMESEEKEQELVNRIMPAMVDYFDAVLGRGGSRAHLSGDMLKLVVQFTTETSDTNTTTRLAWLLVRQLKSGAQFLIDEILNALGDILNTVAETDTTSLTAELVALLGSMNGHERRKRLICCLFKLPDTELADIMAGINATKPHFSDPIDYEVRLETMGGLLERLGSNEFNFEKLLLWRGVTLSVLFTLKHESDLSLQTMCSRILVGLMEKLVEDSKAYESLVHQCLLPSIRKMLRHKDEQRRFEFVMLLSKAVGIFAKVKSGQMAELAALSDDDVELDFFANVTHMQLHRRQRAFARAATQIKAGSVSSRTAERFISPLAVATLNDRSMKEQTQLLNSAMDLIITSAEKTNWAGFRRLLDNQLILAGKQVNQKDDSYGVGSKKETKQAAERQEQKELDQKNAIRIICRLIGVLHWPLDQVSEEVRAEVERLANQNYSDKAALADFALVESKAKSVIKEEKKEKEETIEMDGDKMEEDEEIEEEKEDVEMVEVSKHAPELLAKVYRHLHLHVRPALFKLVSPPKEEDDKLMGSYDERSVRIPVAAALVELLLVLGPGPVGAHAPGVILKLVEMLRSRDFNQRESARKALLGALDKLGSGWFHLFLDELKSGLQRGYQRHVLIASVATLLNNHAFKPGSIDNTVESLSTLLNTDLIGDIGRERKVAKLVEKTPEARKRNQVIGCYRRLGELIGPGVLNPLLEPLKQALLDSIDKNLHAQVDKALSSLAEGLVANELITAPLMVTLVAKMLKENVKVAAEREVKVEQEKPGAKPASCLLLDAPMKRRESAKVERDKLSNRHYLNQFALLLMQTGLKVGKIRLETEAGHVDGIIEDMIQLLANSRHTQEQAKILRILTRLLKHAEMPSLAKNKTKLQKSVFLILKQQCRGTRQNDELVSATFKAVTVLINSAYSSLEDTHLLVLLNYAEEDLYSAERQSYAFPLLHALLKRRLRSEEMESIGDKVLKLAITGETDAARNGARTYLCTYLMEYPLGEAKIEKYVTKLLGNLAYTVESGRVSALACCQLILTHFPPKLIKPRAGLIFASLAATHSGDEAHGMRRTAGEAIRTLVKKYPEKVYWELIVQFSKNQDPEQKRLALLLVTLLIDDHADLMKLEDIFDQVYELFVEEYTDDSTDALLIALLQGFHAIDSQYDLAKRYPNEYASILVRAEKFLVHPHAWARQSATKILLTAIERVNPDELGEKETLNGYWSATKGREIGLRLIVQLKSPHVEREHMAENRELIMLLIKHFHMNEKEQENDEKTKKSDLLWMMQKLNSVAAFENSDMPTQVVRRELVVELLITAMSIFKDKTRHLNVILEVFYREAAASDDSKQTPQELKRAVYKASMIAKGLIGEDLFTAQWELARRQIASRRSERKRNLDQAAVIDPEQFNRMKIRKHEKERERKKRVIEKRKLKAPGSQSKKLKFNSVEKM